MANAKNTVTETETATVEQLVAETPAAPKRRGRPSAFAEGTKIVPLLVNIPDEAREAVRTLAKRRGMGMNAFVADLANKALIASDRVVEQAAARAEAKATKAAAKAAAKTS